MLDTILAQTGYKAAISRLRRMSAETLFQSETPEVPIQILGVLEAAGMNFDHLWVMGLSEEIGHPSPVPIHFYRSSCSVFQTCHKAPRLRRWNLRDGLPMHGFVPRTRSFLATQAWQYP